MGRKKELQKLIVEQKRDDKSQHVSRDGREITLSPSIMKKLKDYELPSGLRFNEYQGVCADDV